MKKNLCLKIICIILAGVNLGFLLSILKNIREVQKSSQKNSLKEERHFNCHYEENSYLNRIQYEKHIYTNKYLVVTKEEDITILTYYQKEDYLTSKNYYSQYEFDNNVRYTFNDDESTIKLMSSSVPTYNEEEELWYKEYKERFDAKYTCEEV